MLVFYIVDLVINVLIFGGFALRFKQTSVRCYLYLAGAVLMQIIADVLNGFLSDTSTLSVVVVYGALIVAMLAGLVYVMVVLYLLQVWIQSMRNAARPAKNKLEKSEKFVKVFRIAYPVLTLLLILFFVLLILPTYFPGILAIIIGFVYTVCVVSQLAIVIWMWLDIQSAANESQLRKRNQLVRIGALTFFSAWPSLLGGVGAGIGMSICWWVWYGIALWPDAFVGYEVEPLDAGVQPGTAYPAPGGYADTKGPEQA